MQKQVLAEKWVELDIMKYYLLNSAILLTLQDEGRYRKYIMHIFNLSEQIWVQPPTPTS